MQIVLQLALLALGFVMLVKGSDWFVDGAAGIAAKFRIPQIIIGLTIVAMGTRAPEAAVSITAAMGGSADITVGNIVGSNILNILVILGLASAIVPVAVGKSTLKIDIPFMIAISVIFLLLGWDGTITRIDGLVLIAFFVTYIGYMIWEALHSNEEGDEIKDMPIWKMLLSTVIGLPMAKAHIGDMGEYYCELVIQESKKLLEAQKGKGKHASSRKRKYGYYLNRHSGGHGNDFDSRAAACG